MKLPEEVLIPREKLTAHLLVSRAKNDKSGFLAQAGFTQQNPDRDNDAVQDRKDEYGTYYRITGTLQGPNGDLNVITVWIYGAKESKYRFITLKPDKE
jgi:hypothetical protein